SVTADGGMIVFDEGITEYDLWATDFRDGVRGAFDRDRSIIHSTLLPKVRISPDGNRLLVGRTDGSATGQWRWSVMPYNGGVEAPISAGGAETMAFWTDSTTVAIAERTGGPWRFSLIDIRTKARRAMLTTRDSSINDFTFLRGGGWAWLP